MEQAYQPLAARLRPAGLEEYSGQTHLLAPGKPLRDALDKGVLHSMILWGPPGVGKTTLARLMASLCDAHFITLSAVLAGVKEIRQAVDEARARQGMGQATILFIDEIHRFNKSQQDAFLPFVEDGTVILVGATTENPSFELNNALLSRMRVYRLRNLEQQELDGILSRALEGSTFGLEDAQRQRLLAAADGDARRLLNLVELCLEMAASRDADTIESSLLDEVLSEQPRRFDKAGDVFYEQISALHKAVRGSAPDAALYWYCRMLDGGCDPFYVARRVVRMASEDIGNADPRALRLALDAWEVQERLGSPEGELAIAQALLFLACAPKSNAVYKAYNSARQEAQSSGSIDVPLHLRNAPTALMKQEGYAVEYRYAHDEPDALAAGESYMPEALHGRRYYYPVARGLEKKIQEKLDWIEQRNRASGQQRWSTST